MVHSVVEGGGLAPTDEASQPRPQTLGAVLVVTSRKRNILSGLMNDPRRQKPLYWATGAKQELMALPQEVVHNFGYALSAVQFGARPATSVKALSSFVLPVLELRDSNAQGTYRAVYCTALDGVIYVLHCFQKKSHTGGKIPQEVSALIRRRLKEVRMHYEEVVKGS
jgi:phage-related protein